MTDLRVAENGHGDATTVGHAVQNGHGPVNGVVQNGQHTRFMNENFDPDDPEYVREMQRPAIVTEDLQEMKRRERVSAVLKSASFRDELETIIQDAMKAGCNPTSLLALQQISELVLPQNRFNQAGMLTSSAQSPRGGAAPIIPVADIRGVDALNYNKGEKHLRCKLASLYRLVDQQGWTHGIYNHITVRASSEYDHFLINPFGLLYREITASSLVKVDLSGQIVDSGSTTLGINPAGYLLHSAIHGARPDLKCVIHFHTGPCAAVASMKQGLLPISQEAGILGDISYHEYGGILVDEAERDRIIRSLGPFNKVMLLRNHGIVAAGTTIEEAFHYAFNVVAACETQYDDLTVKYSPGPFSLRYQSPPGLHFLYDDVIRAMSAGMDNLLLMSAETAHQAHQVGSNFHGLPVHGGGGKKWKIGELEWEAWMRSMDNQGYRTGHVYKNPLIRTDQSGRQRSNQDVEIPPSAYGLSGYGDDDTIGMLLKEYLERKKGFEKVRWLNTPNAYQKVELLETGTNEPKRVTKWVQDNSTPSPGGTPIKVNNLQFSPLGTDVREFRAKQQQMKDKRNQGLISSGPESRVLDGVTWDEAERMPDALMSGSGDRLITVGAVSKGIIRRDQQHNVGAYQSTYQRNPFDSNTPEDVEQYLLEVKKKKQGSMDGHPNDQYEIRMEQKQPSSARETQPRQPLTAQNDNTQTFVRQAKTPPPTPSTAKTDASASSFSRSKSERFGKVPRSGTFPGRTAPSGLQRTEEDDVDTGSEPTSPSSERALRKSDTLDSGDLENSKSDKKKKKKGFRMPSFSLGRKKSKEGLSGESEL